MLPQSNNGPLHSSTNSILFFFNVFLSSISSDKLFNDPVTNNLFSNKPQQPPKKPFLNPGRVIFKGLM